MFLTYLYLFLETLLPIGMAIGIFLLQKYTRFGKIRFWYRQVIIGIIFGGVAIFGTEFGVPIDGGAVANIRDAGPMVAALIFGGPSGMIAGVIGGVERYIAVSWGAGEYSQIACTISTILAGFITALVRRKMFYDRVPSWVGGLVVAIFMEVSHLMILFLTKITQPYECIEVLKQLTVPMIFANAFAVTVACFGVNLLLREKGTKVLQTLNQKIQFWLLMLIAGAYVGSVAFIYVSQTYYADNTAQSVLALNANDVSEHIISYSNELMDDIVEYLTYTYTSEDKNLQTVLEAFQGTVTELNIISLDDKGIVLDSTDVENIGYQMVGGPQSSAQSVDFHTQMLTKGYYVQEFEHVDVMQKYMKFGAQNLSFTYHGQQAYIQAGVDAHTFYASGITNIVKIFTSHRHVYNSGFLVIFDYDNDVVSDPGEHIGIPIGITSQDLDGLNELTMYRHTIFGIDCFYMFREAETYYTIAAIPVGDVFNSRDTMIYSNSFVQIIIYGFIFALAYFVIEKLVVKYINNTNATLKLITQGDLNQKVEPNRVLELNELSNSINYTVDTLKDYIEKAASRIDQELEFARKIQSSVLPNVFPAFPSRKDLDIYAKMYTARQVGGDFYDFYFIDRDDVAFLVADVSGKGIPASMFMMEAKTSIKNFATSLDTVNDIFFKANNDLAENNSANMFVTSWMGIINLKTGILKFANAGHNTPLIYRKDKDSWEYLEQKKDMVLAGMTNVPYHEQEIKLNNGDRIFLYTDGVTEATREDNKLYGEERLLAFLNSHTKDGLEIVLNKVKQDIDVFVDGADQFDDITMLIFEYKG